MFKKNRIVNAIQFSLIFGASTTLPFAQADEAEASQETKIEKIQVTGSRIKRFEFSQPSPILTLTGEEIQQAGTPDLASVLAELPSIGATGTLRANTNGQENAGSSTIDLRRLGTDRTLVLINGKRHVAGQQGSSVVDLGTIPTTMIKRVEVITGGASAVYGSDAVSGVVNVILRDDFEGIELKANYSDSLHGIGNSSKSFSIVGGVTTADGRGNSTFYISKENIEEVMTRDMPNYSEYGVARNPENGGEDDGIPDNVWAPNLLSEWISQTSVLDGGGANYTFTNDGKGTLMPLRDLTNSPPFGSFFNGCELCFSTTRYNNYSPEVDKLVVGNLFNYELTDNIKFYSDIKYVRNDGYQQDQPSYRFGQGDEINLNDNPYLPDEAREFFKDNDDGVVTINKFFDEIGNRVPNNKRETFRLLTGFEGEFTLSDSVFNYDVYYSYGRTENERIIRNDLISGNWVAALDVVINPETGAPDCRSNVASAQGDDYVNPATVDVNGCVPYNPFGLGQASQEAMDYVTADIMRNDTIKQRYFGGVVSSDLGEFFELPGGAIGYAVGFEKRWESSGVITDELTKSGVMNEVATPDSYGEYDVSEWFIEANFPILSDAYLAHELSIDAAFRTADYSHAGNTDAWKLGFMWSPFEGYSLRGTYGEAVRAPNITEAFSPRSPEFDHVWDPCDKDRINDISPTRAGNCAALGIPAGFVGQDNASKRVIMGGNPELTPEESTSFTLGFVSTAFENLSFSIDYYDIEITDAISSISAERVAQNCVDGEGLNEVYCSQVTRDPVTHVIQTVESGYLNTAKLALNGMELDVKYSLDMAELDLPGNTTFSLFVNRVFDLDRAEFQSRPDVVDRLDGQVGDPTWQATFGANYRYEDIRISWKSNYIDRSARYDLNETYTDKGEKRGDTPEDSANPYAPTFITHDVSVNYTWSDNLVVEAGVRNAFNKILPDYVSGRGRGSSIYDPWGRRFFVNATYNF